MIRVVLPAHLRTLARVDGEVAVHVQEPVTLGAVLDAVEVSDPVSVGVLEAAHVHLVDDAVPPPSEMHTRPLDAARGRSGSKGQGGHWGASDGGERRVLTLTPAPFGDIRRGTEMTT